MPSGLSSITRNSNSEIYETAKVGKRTFKFNHGFQPSHG